jgi:DNA-binding HxlR family transcriptional regulator
METARWDMLKQQCPTRQVLTRIADKWTMLVITLLAEGEKLRFSELRRQIEGISQKMLTQTLRGLERDGLVVRTVYPTVPVTVEYRLTDLGVSLGETVGAIRRWAYANMDEIEAARERYDATVHAPVAALNAA